jgi:hypothetical protein
MAVSAESLRKRAGAAPGYVSSPEPNNTRRPFSFLSVRRAGDAWEGFRSAESRLSPNDQRNDFHLSHQTIPISSLCQTKKP